MERVVVSSLDDSGVEFVERKGLGHPDTICDALAETLSRNLCRIYRERFGRVLHHNVDKALLCGGRSDPAFGGGKILAPISITLAGRAAARIAGEIVPIEEIAIEGSRAWLKDNLHALDADRDVRIASSIQPGSADLRTLFEDRRGPLANDTSIGVGHAPLSPLERLALAAERRVNGRDRRQDHPAWGEDVKVMGIRVGRAVEITVACAMIGRFLASIDDYVEEKAAIDRLVRTLAEDHGFEGCKVNVNAADDIPAGRIYLTVSGTSAEAGDDGQVGRGNRVNGLITPCQPMSLEAAAGKNPVTHVGKIYNIMAREIARRLVDALPEIERVQCLMVSTIGQPVARPTLVQVKLRTRDGLPADRLEASVAEIVTSHVADMVARLDDLAVTDVF